VTVNVKFPDPYENNPDYAGKDASFAVTVKGIYELGEFNDAFVKKNLSDYAQTDDEYKQYLKDTNYESNLENAISEYIADNISANQYPKDYVKHLKSLQMTLDEEEYNYMAQMYAAYGMSFDYSSVMQYKGAANADEYETILQEAAEKACLNNMAYQDLAAKAGITVSDEDFETFKTENEITDEMLEQYGKAYLIQHYIIPEKVQEYVKEHVTIE
jgi:trigger factor